MSPARTNRSSIPGGRGPTGLVFDITVDGPAVEAMAPQIPMSAKGFSDRPTARHRAPSRRLLARTERTNRPGRHRGDEQDLVRAREEDAAEQQALQADAEPPAQLIEQDARGQAQRQEHGHGRVARNLRRAREFRDAHRAEDDEPRRGPQREESHVISDGEAAERRVGETVADEGDILEDDEDAQERAEEGDEDSDEEGALDGPVGQLGKDLVERAHGFGSSASGRSSRSICAGWRSKATGSPSKSRVPLRNAIRRASFATLWTSWDVRTIGIPRSRFRVTTIR